MITRTRRDSCIGEFLKKYLDLFLFFEKFLNNNLEVDLFFLKPPTLAIDDFTEARRTVRMITRAVLIVRRNVRPPNGPAW